MGAAVTQCHDHIILPDQRRRPCDGIADIAAIGAKDRPAFAFQQGIVDDLGKGTAAPRGFSLKAFLLGEIIICRLAKAIQGQPRLQQADKGGIGVFRLL